jgi:hypothetical protein
MFVHSVFCFHGTEYLVMAYECYSHRSVFSHVSALLPMINKATALHKQLIQC